MTKSYSNDLRQKVVEYLDEGNSYDKASVRVEQFLIKELKPWPSCHDG